MKTEGRRLQTEVVEEKVEMGGGWEGGEVDKVVVGPGVKLHQGEEICILINVFV